jgi:hypothetical protein
MTALGIPLTREGLKEYAALSKPPSDFEMAIAGYSEAEKRRLRGLYVQNQTIGVQRLAFDQQKFAWERANPGFELRENADGTVYGVNKRTRLAQQLTPRVLPARLRPLLLRLPRPEHH